jgi:RNA methyltransferase, TrmH family
MITSKDNDTVKHVRKLITSSKYRREHQSYVLENQRFIEDTIHQSPHLILDIIYANTLGAIKDRLDPNTRLTEVSEDIFKTLPSIKHSFGALAICKIEHPSPSPNPDIIIYLDTINNPNNLGAILRNAAAFNCGLVVLSPDSTDPYHPESIRASAGHVLKTPIITAPLEKVLKDYPNVHVYILDSNSKNAIEEVNIKKPALFIFGSESGLSDITKQHVQDANSFKISINPLVDSLNVAATSAIILYEINKKGYTPE